MSGAFNNRIGQISLKLGASILGASLVALSYFDKISTLDKAGDVKEVKSLNTLIRAAGYFLIPQLFGYLFVEKWVKIWKASEDKDGENWRRQMKGSDQELNTQSEGENDSSTEKKSSITHISSDASDISDVSESEGEQSDRDYDQPIRTVSSESIAEAYETPQPKTSLRTRVCRLVAKTASSIGIEVLATVLWFNQEELFLIIGGAYSMLQYLQQRKFQVLSLKKYQSQIKRNHTEDGKIKTALKVERVATVAFIALYICWFVYGSVFSDNEDRIGIIILVLTYVSTCIVALLTEKYFKPEQTGLKARFINHLRYTLYHNPYWMALAFLSLEKITRLTDSSLELDPLPEYICGLLGIFFFGLNFGDNRMKNTSESGFTTVGPAVARMWLLLTLVDGLDYKLGTLRK